MFRNTCFVLALVSSSAAMQTGSRVWKVPGDFATLPDAVAGASAGDIVLALPGAAILQTLVIDKPLTLMSDSARIVLGGKIVFTGIPAGAQAELRGIDAIGGVDVLANDGLVWLEDTRVDNFTSAIGLFTQGLRIEDSADVVLLRATVHGADGADLTRSPGPGVSLLHSQLHAFGCTFTGGKAALRANGRAGLEIQSGQNFAFLSGCRLTGGDSLCYDFGICYGRPGSGIFGRSAVVLDSEIHAGAASSSGFCTCSAPDENGSVQHLPGVSLAMTTTSPEREGQSVTYTFSGPPSVPVWLALTLHPDGRYLPQLTGSALVSAPLLSLRRVGTTDASGQLQTIQTVPALLSGASGLRIFAQSYYASPLVLGQGSMITVLDSSL